MIPAGVVALPTLDQSTSTLCEDSAIEFLTTF